MCHSVSDSFASLLCYDLVTWNLLFSFFLITIYCLKQAFFLFFFIFLRGCSSVTSVRMEILAGLSGSLCSSAVDCPYEDRS